jgi:hypothetical protein
MALSPEDLEAAEIASLPTTRTELREAIAKIDEIAVKRPTEAALSSARRALLVARLATLTAD